MADGQCAYRLGAVDTAMEIVSNNGAWVSGLLDKMPVREVEFLRRNLREGDGSDVIYHVPTVDWNALYDESERAAREVLHCAV